MNKKDTSVVNRLSITDAAEISLTTAGKNKKTVLLTKSKNGGSIMNKKIEEVLKTESKDVADLFEGLTEDDSAVAATAVALLKSLDKKPENLGKILKEVAGIEDIQKAEQVVVEPEVEVDPANKEMQGKLEELKKQFTDQMAEIKAERDSYKEEAINKALQAEAAKFKNFDDQEALVHVLHKFVDDESADKVMAMLSNIDEKLGAASTVVAEMNTLKKMARDKIAKSLPTKPATAAESIKKTDDDAPVVDAELFDSVIFQ